MNSFIIPFAFENWSEKYSWWVPNNCPADFTVNGVDHVGELVNMYPDNNILTNPTYYTYDISNVQSDITIHASTVAV